MYPGDDGYPETAPVKSYDEGRGRWDLWDLAGNVLEWTDSWYCDYDESKRCNKTYRVYRGTAWIHGYVSLARVSGRLRAEPSVRFSFLGFRCARTVEPPALVTSP
jgi:formylglycine-generating enzyme required for sulfatase activity